VNSPIGSNGKQYLASPSMRQQEIKDRLPMEIYVLVATRFHQPAGVSDMECARGRA